MDVMQRSTKAALTILEELEPVGSPPTAVPPLSGAAETYFELPLESDEVLASAIAEIPPGATQLPEDPEPHERRSRALWLGPLAALLLGGVGLWAWAPWQAAAPVLEPVPATAPETLEPEAPDPDPAAEEVSEPSEDQPVIPTATDDAVVEAQPEPEAALLAAPTVQPELESTPADPATSASAVAGRWAGSYNGQDVTLQLSGGDQALRGTLTVEFFGNEQSSTVRGSFAEGRLVLEDQDRNDDYASKHVGTLGADGRIEGQSTTFKGGRVTSFTFWR
jgi:outer membrane biosynthesis protein TonB